MAIVSGTYEGKGVGVSGTSYALTLRVDLERQQELGQLSVSGDLFQDASDPVNLVGSFASTAVHVDGPTGALGTDIVFYEQPLSGKLNCTGSTGANGTPM